MKTGKGSAARRWSAGILTTLVLAAAATACGGGDDAGPVLSAAGERGRQLSLSSGCAGCHGTNGQGGVGPTWQGLAGSDVELVDGTVIVADEAYLVRAIKEPAADLLAGSAIQMPQNNLDDAQVADIVAYINDLASVDPDR